MDDKVAYQARDRTIELLLSLPKYADCPTNSRDGNGKPRGYYDACYIQENDGRIIGVSDNTIVLGLGSFTDEDAYLCSKFFHIDRQYAPKGNIGIIGHSIALSERRVEKVAEALRESGFDVPFHRQFFYKDQFTKFRNPAFTFVVAEDLTEGGLYQVLDAFDYDFQNPDLAQEYRGTVTRLKDSGIVEAERHIATPDSAFEHMLFVRKDISGNEHDIKIGDLDHIMLSRKAQPHK
jgi:hypothetical protein